MAISFDAVYEDGVLKPVNPLPLKEHEKVRVTIQSEVSVAEQTAGMLKWTRDMESLDRLASDLEFGILGSR